jgi:type II secretory pathway pseudopilin PulG
MVELLFVMAIMIGLAAIMAASIGPAVTQYELRLAESAPPIMRAIVREVAKRFGRVV